MLKIVLMLVHVFSGISSQSAQRHHFLPHDWHVSSQPRKLRSSAKSTRKIEVVSNPHDLHSKRNFFSEHAKSALERWSDLCAMTVHALKGVVMMMPM
jgi:hypothetical protein